MVERHACDVCANPLPPHGFYILRMDLFAEPSVPAATADELDDVDAHAAMASLIEQMKGMTADQLQDDIHRRFEYRLCRPCQRKFLANPLGLPRTRRSSAS